MRTSGVVGRLAWTEDGQFHTPWLFFNNITAFHQWCALMRTAIVKRDGVNRRKLKSEYHFVNAVWTADSLLRMVQAEADN
jgi:hypothetical protein